MNGRYRIPLAPGQDPADNPVVVCLLASLDPGAEVTIEVREEQLTVSTLGSDRDEWGRRVPVPQVTSSRWADIRAVGGVARQHKPVLPVPRPLAALSIAAIGKRLAGVDKCVARYGLAGAWYPRLPRSDWLAASEAGYLEAEREHWREMLRLAEERKSGRRRAV